MLIPPKYTLNSKITTLLQEIEGAKEVIDNIYLPQEIETNLRRRTTLQSSLFSARIEGNTLTEETLSKGSKTQQKVEVFNILKAQNWLAKRAKKDITTKDIKTLHEITLKGLSPDAGNYRKEFSAIFNSQGIAVYMPPPPNKIESSLEKLIKFVHSDKEKLVPIKAALAHYTFEKIHPFLDGNGRVGRLLMQQILIQGGYEMKGLVSIEKEIDADRENYYSGLDEPEKEVTDYIEYILTKISKAAVNAKKMVLGKEKFTPENFLLPRREEIYLIIKDQKMVNFNQIKRRFPSLNERTLRYDLKKLQDGGFIIKRGTTKGVYYTSKNN